MRRSLQSAQQVYVAGCAVNLHASQFAEIDPGVTTMRYTSYAGNAGTWVLWYQQQLPPQPAMNGLFYVRSAVTFASVTDGSSNTLAFSERAHSMLDADSALWWNWWAAKRSILSTLTSVNWTRPRVSSEKFFFPRFGRRPTWHMKSSTSWW